MIEVGRDGELYLLTVSDMCHAPADVMYDLLADLASHMEWGGSWHATRTQRLQSMDAPAGPATVGTEFSSVGAASGGSWYDRSRVTAATRPSHFEFETNGILRDGQGVDRMSLLAVHKYRLVEVDGGTHITYECSARLTLHAPRGDHHPRLPVVIFNLVVPSVVERGLANLIRLGEQQVAGVTFDSVPAKSMDPLAWGF
jgi:hypothetical protein